MLFTRAVKALFPSPLQGNHTVLLLLAQLTSPMLFGLFKSSLGLFTLLLETIRDTVLEVLLEHDGKLTWRDLLNVLRGQREALTYATDEA